MTAPALVTIVDDDVSVREALLAFVRQFGFSSRAFLSAEQFLASDSIARTRCLILDVTLRGKMSGLALKNELLARGWDIPTIFITGQEDERVRTRVLEQGAVAYLVKPFSDEDLLRALRTALDLK